MLIKTKFFDDGLISLAVATTHQLQLPHLSAATAHHLRITVGPGPGADGRPAGRPAARPSLLFGQRNGAALFACLFPAYFGLFCLVSSHMVLLNQPKSAGFSTS